ncbi:type VI secretion system-associated protein TagF [Xenophilus sp. Marseille-Q4582]|uniref:type VI secretion system-associated protein TagF n=1 Tax=Xenophilus sp. Marseille-Q4582 TaxID=2866600 RepID=UPI001CE45E92|nr:type VI secretion system-associated protein TagF [Xenophilus sp. Marseille-Q4582]
MSSGASFSATGMQPGWFGKLPGMGDFAHRRLPEAFRERWDHWLQTGLLHLRQQHAQDWTARYLQSPLWFFVLAPQVAGARPWIGVLMPSVDGVGRYFPFTIACELADPLHTLSGARWLDLARWWRHAAHCALAALEQDLDAAGVDALLGHAPPPGAGSDGADAPPPLRPDWPADGQSLWLTDLCDARAARLRTAGLPRSARFERLFGFDDTADALPLN